MISKSKKIPELEYVRRLHPAEEKNTIIEDIAKYQENIELRCIYSIQACNSVRFDQEQPVIIWDECYWKYFRKYEDTIVTARKNNLNLTQAVISVMSEFLEERFGKFKKLSRFLGQIHEVYGIKDEPDRDSILIIEERTIIAQIFSFFHEVGHVRLWQKNEVAEKSGEIVRSMFSQLRRENFDKLGQWADLSYTMVTEILQGKHKSLFEELMVDVYAAGKLGVFLENWKHLIGFSQICEALISVEAVLSFQNLLNIVSKAWEQHYTELRFGIPPRQHEVDPHINQIETVRGGLGHILVSVILMKYFNLDQEEQKKAWDICDREHVDNSDVMECLASERFICTAIQEAMY